MGWQANDREASVISLREAALDSETILKHARKAFRGGGAELIRDVASDVVLELYERHERNPGKRIEHTGAAIRFATLDVYRRRIDVYKREIPSQHIDILARRQAGQYRVMEIREEIELEKETDDQIAEWRSLPVSERQRRIAEADRSLLTLIPQH